MTSLLNSMNNLRLCRFQSQSNDARIGLITNENSIVDLTASGIHRMDTLLESDDIKERISKISENNLTKITTDVDLDLKGLLSPFGFLPRGNMESAMNTALASFVEYSQRYDDEAKIIDDLYQEILLCYRIHC